jgi:CelD/BcsL family acetyltransferase involved in cellulose biosynthesis
VVDRIYALKPRELRPEQLQAWARIQAANEQFSSPFFTPEYNTLASSVWERVMVGVLEAQGKPVGFFPFERHPLGMGRPVAPLVSDFQGVVVDAGVEWTAEELLRGCRLYDMEFNHLLACQQQWQACHGRTGPSPAMDVAAGFEAYAAGRRQAGSVLQRLYRQQRQFEKEIGPLRFEMDVRETAGLDWVVAEKSRQCEEKGYTNALAVPGIRRFVEAIFNHHSEGFAGVLSVLYAGDRIAAAHMGMRSASVWHYWFPVYDDALSKYSPGLLLLLRMAELAPQMGMRRIDLGKGDAVYKQRLGDTGTLLAEARATSTVPGARLFKVISGGRDKLRSAAWAKPVRSLYRRIVYR